ncbi:MAG: 4-alpha-glucanotransferase [Bacteroidetes bacterium]|nr:MAG: 4-alpha-glucanotransferase [Bacteroidota bacterium]
MANAESIQQRINTISKMKRSSGILLHITSLPGKYGIGTMGQEAFNFVNYLVESGQKLWQILPLGHTGYGDSPYQCYSAFAGNPLLIDLDKLVQEGLLKTNDLPDNIYFDDENVDYGKVHNVKYPLLHKAYENHTKNPNRLRSVKFDNFCHKNHKWLDDYAFFMALKKHFKGVAWTQWENDIKFKKPDSINYYREHLSDDINYYRFVQFLFYKQWLELKAYANLNEIKIIGDIPLFVAFDSSDAWAHPDLFDFDAHLNPINVAGVPPDYFSETGQLWGNPLYNWERLKETGYQWWIDRIEASFTLYDTLRIDHYRGLAAYWAVPFGEETAINGQWIEAPGGEMIQTVLDALGELDIIAEDLGVITPDVVELRERFGFPGMKIIQFAFDSGEENDFMPHTYDKNFVVYTGTHDNDTSLGQYKSSSEKDKKHMSEYFCVDKSDPAWSYVKLAWSTVADVALAPMQDFLRLDTDARMNYPGKASGNWRWRYTKDKLTPELAEELFKITRLYGR